VWVEPVPAAPLGPVRIPGAGDSWFAARPRPVLLGAGALVVAFVLGVLAVHKFALGAAAVVAVALVVAVLLRPVIGGIVLVGTVPALSGLAPGFPVPHVRVSELIVGLVGATVLVSARRSDAVAWSSLDWLLLAYGLAWALLGAFDAIALHQSLSLDQWGTDIGQLQFFLIYRGVRVSLRRPSERRLAVGVLVGAAVPVALLALLQELHVGVVSRLLNTITGGLTATLLASVETGNTLRATGPFNNWAALAGYLFPILLVLCALSFAGQLGRYRKWAFGVGLLVLIGLLITVEISAIVLALVGVAILARQYGLARRVLRYLAAAVVIGALVAAPFIAPRLNAEFSASAGSSRHVGVPQTLAFRFDVWTEQYVPAIEARPLTGYGAQLPASIAWPYPESQYVAFLIEGGIPLFVLFAALGWAMLARSGDAARAADPFEQALGRAAVLAVAGMLVMNLIWPFLSNGGLPQVLWCLLAVALPRRRGVPAPSAPAPCDPQPSLVGGAS
jgi:hypothetical protein